MFPWKLAACLALLLVAGFAAWVSLSRSAPPTPYSEPEPFVEAPQEGPLRFDRVRAVAKVKTPSA
ncbi:MAG: hypothetical protein K2W96_20700, partial [Gemmataceae bacterium]|nr:hypothetical protein [Gemmataceae bacterium]